MFDLSLAQLLLRAAAFLILIGVHGFALAAIARLLGDRGPGYDGKLTLNPLTHLDLLGLAAALFFQMGWIRQIAIDHRELVLRRVGLVVCVLGSLAVTLLFAVLLQQLRVVAVTTLPQSAADTVVALIRTVGQMSVWFVIVNLIPIPPLTGAHLLRAVLPDSVRPRFDRLAYAGMALLAVLMLTGVLETWLRPAQLALSAQFFPV